MIAARHYARIDRASRVEGASPHGLVLILFEELQRCLSRGGDPSARTEHRDDAISRAHAILTALELSLDFGRGGETAVTLARVYRATRGALMNARHRNDPEWCNQASTHMAPIVDAWRDIGQTAA